MSTGLFYAIEDACNSVPAKKLIRSGAPRGGLMRYGPVFYEGALATLAKLLVMCFFRWQAKTGLRR